MDLNDPKRRLQVLKANSPSLRVAAAPQQQVQIAAAKQPTLISPSGQKVAYTPTIPKPTVAQPVQKKPLDDPLGFLGKTAQDFGHGVGSTILEGGRQTVQGTDQLITALAHGISSDDAGIDARRAKRQAAIDALFPKQEDQAIKTAGELTAYVAPIGVANKAKAAVEGFNFVKNLVGSGSKAKAALGWLLPKVAESATTTGVATGMGLGDENAPIEQQLGTNAAIDIGVQAGTGMAGKLFVRLKNLNKVIDKEGVTNAVIKSSDPKAIQNTLKVDPGTAQFLASEKNPETIKSVLNELSVDPNLNIPDDIRARLQEEGVSAVRKQDNPYGAEYNPNDSSISVRDQSFATPDNLYHELGHAIWSKQLTPEEKALFKGEGAASKSAVGRPGYGKDEIDSEDFSDYLRMASQGKIAEIPENVRDVVLKYAKIAQEATPNTVTLPAEDLAAIKAAGGEAPTKPFAPLDKTTTEKLLNLDKSDSATPIPDGHTRLYQTNDSASQKSDQFFQDKDKLANYINGRSENATLDFVDVPTGQVKAVPGKPDVFKVDEAAKVQTGVSDGVVDGSGKTTSPEALGDEFSGKPDNNTELGTNTSVTPENASGYKPGFKIEDGGRVSINSRAVRKANAKTLRVRDKTDGEEFDIEIKEDVRGDVIFTRSKDGNYYDSATRQSLTKRFGELSDEELAAKSVYGTGEVVKLSSSNPPSLTKVGDDPELIRTKEEIKSLEEQLNDPNSDSRFVREQLKNANARLKQLEGSSASTFAKNADEIVPNGDPDTKKAVQEVLDNLNGAQKSYDDAAKTRTQEKAARISKADGAYQAAGGGEQGFRAKLGSLKGKYSESGFNPITASESTQNTILDDIESSSLRSFEKLNLQNAMRKIWGSAEGKPTPGEINQIRKYFGEDGDKIADNLEEAIANDPKTWRDKIVDIAGIPRAAMASFDLSMGLRQGGQVAVRNFPEWVNANKESVKYVANKEYFKNEMKKIADDDAYETITDKLGVRLPAVEGHSDEVMASANMLEKVPVYGRGVEASDRAYSGGLTKLRWNIAKQWIDSLGGTDQVLKDFSEKELRDMGEVINTSTGSGGKKGGFTERHMQTLATTLFAPRLWASRLNAINPAYYARLSGPARNRAIQNIASFMGVAATVTGLAAAAGADVEWDPRSSDFMKIKTGNTRFDVFGGLQQNIVFFARMISGQKKDSSTGEIATLADGYNAPNRLDLAADMLQNKLNPLLGYAARLLQSGPGDTGNPNDRKDKFGQDMNVAGEASKLLIPLGVQGVADTYDDTGDLGKSVALNAPSFLGVGVQTYGNTKTKDQGKDAQGNAKFAGEITPDMVLDHEGQPMLNEKGKPITAKFDDNATETEKKAALKKAQNTAYLEKAKSLLSPEDNGLYKTGQADPDSLDDAQKKKYDQIKKWVSDYGQKQSIPRELTSNQSKTFYQKYNSMTKDDQKAWLEEAPDDNAKTIATELNKLRVPGISEFKPSNALSKAYSEFEKDINSHPEYTALDKQNKKKAFQTFAYKLNYSTDQKDIYAEGGSTDLKTLLDEGSVTRDDLNEAIKMDDELFGSGLTGSLQFSKKFRSQYGYGAPSKGGSGGSGGGDSGGSGEGSKRAYLAAYLPDSSGAKGTPAPQFSSKRRTQGISFKDVKTPSKKSSKKVTINL